MPKKFNDKAQKNTNIDLIIFFISKSFKINFWKILFSIVFIYSELVISEKSESVDSFHTVNGTESLKSSDSYNDSKVLAELSSEESLLNGNDFFKLNLHLRFKPELNHKKPRRDLCVFICFFVRWKKRFNSEKTFI